MTDEDPTPYSRYQAAIDDEARGVWDERGTQIMDWAQRDGASWLWAFVNQRLRASVDVSAADALVSSSLRALFDGLGHGLFLLSTNAVVLHANARAEALLEERVPFARQDDGQLQATVSGAREVLAAMAALQDTAPQHLRVQPVVGDPPGLDEYFVRIQRLGGGNDEPVVPIALLQLWCAIDSAAPDVSALRAWFGLTPAEARLASRFAAGTTLADYAESEALSMNTVRTQFAHMRQKMGARDQADVLRILHRLTGI